MRVDEIRGGPAQAAAVGPVPAIDALLAKKPNARIAVVQGSFDWFHNGHLELAGNAAAAGYDLVVVMPTAEYERKPYLRNAFDRRLALASQAIASRPELAGRVVVSDA